MDLVKTRKQAQLDGDKHYYTGVVCTEGHDSKRYTKSDRCITCENIYSKLYVKTNKARILLTKAKNRSKKKKLEFNIDITDVIIPKKCPVLGIDIITDVQGKYTYNSPSIDRIDNNKGYIKGNVRVISHRANHLKNDATSRELRMVMEDLEKLENLYENDLETIKETV